MKMSPYSGAGRLLLLGCSIGAVLAHSPVTEGNHNMVAHTYIHIRFVILTFCTYILTYRMNGPLIAPKIIAAMDCN